VRRLIKILVNVLLAFGWTWTVYAKDENWVNDTQRLYVLLGLLGLFLGKEIFSLVQKPVGKTEVMERQDVIEDYLGTVLDKYYTELDFPKEQELPAIRINLALLTYLSFFRKRMMIYYTSGAKEGYAAAEFEMKFKKGEGVIGTAWEVGEPAFFPVSRGKQLTVSAEKRELVKNIKSALSAPLKAKNGKVIAILSMDSEFPIETTKFSQDEIIKFAQAAAKKLEPFCFSTGVKRN
jgi:hypothetical protein